jgi:tetratricopeptide (TPR) repeat protein
LESGNGGESLKYELHTAHKTIVLGLIAFLCLIIFVGALGVALTYSPDDMAEIHYMHGQEYLIRFEQEELSDKIAFYLLEQAREETIKAIYLNPSHLQAWENFARIEYEQGQHQSAMEAIRVSNALDSDLNAAPHPYKIIPAAFAASEPTTR